MTQPKINTLTPGPEDLKALFDAQQKARWRVAATGVEERKAKLKRLAEKIRQSEEAICDAIYKDFGKHPHESAITEINPTLEELAHNVRHLGQWMKPHKVSTPLAIAGAASMIRYEPRGVVLILAPWNYPFYLAIVPFAAAIAAGNCVVMRSSEKVGHTARLMHDMIAELFPQDEAAVVLGGHSVADQLLEMPFDHFFFTGSTGIGRKVMTAAAKHLATVTLELGGKSPVVVDETACLETTAERIVWGKFINAGQTCVAPDYVMVHEKVYEPLISALKATIERFYGASEGERLNSESFASLVDGRSLNRLDKAIQDTINAGARKILGGEKQAERRRLSPTVLADVPFDSAIMAEEIFGPVLPLMPIRSLEDGIAFIRSRPKPLAMYIFSRSDQNIERLLSATTAGGTTVNNTILHLANSNLPFGGVGESGQGHYHGWYGFETFSHARSVYRQQLPTGVKLLYPPYGESTRKALRMLKMVFG